MLFGGTWLGTAGAAPSPSAWEGLCARRLLNRLRGFLGVCSPEQGGFLTSGAAKALGAALPGGMRSWVFCTPSPPPRIHPSSSSGSCKVRSQFPPFHSNFLQLQQLQAARVTVNKHKGSSAQNRKQRNLSGFMIYNEHL